MLTQHRVDYHLITSKLLWWKYFFKTLAKENINKLLYTFFPSPYFLVFFSLRPSLNTVTGWIYNKLFDFSRSSPHFLSERLKTHTRQQWKHYYEIILWRDSRKTTRKTWASGFPVTRKYTLNNNMLITATKYRIRLWSGPDQNWAGTVDVLRGENILHKK